ncbi:hypothetical protein [Trichloromonas sp.]|uniref:hypothetical protein n=1 Tax=Trichloromonas sp. TaxID=3069249 RepID=UPI002A449217|nr:hypothetical protein [Trichloromonas sp.]
MGANTNLEKLFFAKILEEPNQFYKVESKYFENELIRFVYDVIREYYINSKDKIVPSPKQVWSMVSLQDDKKLVSKEALKSLFTETTQDITDEWLDRSFKAWKSSKYTRDKIYESIDIIKNMDEVNYDNVMDIVGRLKKNFSEIDIISNDDEDLGGDFDDPEEHKQLISLRKIPTGWSNLDKILGGGWDHATFNIIMGETNVGKCLIFNTLIKIKNKKTNKIEKIKIGDFFNMIKKSS